MDEESEEDMEVDLPDIEGKPHPHTLSKALRINLKVRRRIS